MVKPSQQWESDCPASSLSAGQALTDHRSVNITWSQTDPGQAQAEKLEPNIITQTKLFYFLAFIMLTCLASPSFDFVETHDCFVLMKTATMRGNHSWTLNNYNFKQ